MSLTPEELTAIRRRHEQARQWLQTPLEAWATAMAIEYLREAQHDRATLLAHAAALEMRLADAAVRRVTP